MKCQSWHRFVSHIRSVDISMYIESSDSVDVCNTLECWMNVTVCAFIDAADVATSCDYHKHAQMLAKIPSLNEY